MDAYDCALQQDIIFRVMPHIKPADNPQQAETCSHIGLKGNYFCRRCKVGGTAEKKESEEGYHSLFTVRDVLLAFWNGGFYSIIPIPARRAAKSPGDGRHDKGTTIPSMSR